MGVVVLEAALLEEEEEGEGEEEEDSSSIPALEVERVVITCSAMRTTW